MVLLQELLARRILRNVKVVTFPEGKLKEVSSTLRKGLALTAGVATVAADQKTSVEGDDD